MIIGQTIRWLACLIEHVPTFKPSLEDVLARYIKALVAYPVDTVVRLTGDRPLIGPSIVDAVVSLRRQSGADYASNIDPPSFLDGTDIEVFVARSLLRASEPARLLSQRERVTPWMRVVEIGLYCVNLRALADLFGIRLTVDYLEGLELARKLVSLPAGRQSSFDLFDVLRFSCMDPKFMIKNPSERKAG